VAPFGGKGECRGGARAHGRGHATTERAGGGPQRGGGNRVGNWARSATLVREEGGGSGGMRGSGIVEAEEGWRWGMGERCPDGPRCGGNRRSALPGTRERGLIRCRKRNAETTERPDRRWLWDRLRGSDSRLATSSGEKRGSWKRQRRERGEANGWPTLRWRRWLRVRLPIGRRPQTGAAPPVTRGKVTVRVQTPNRRVKAAEFGGSERVGTHAGQLWSGGRGCNIQSSLKGA